MTSYYCQLRNLSVTNCCCSVLCWLHTPHFLKWWKWQLSHLNETLDLNFCFLLSGLQSRVGRCGSRDWGSTAAIPACSACLSGAQNETFKVHVKTVYIRSNVFHTVTLHNYNLRFQMKLEIIACFILFVWLQNTRKDYIKRMTGLNDAFYTKYLEVWEFFFQLFTSLTCRSIPSYVTPCRTMSGDVITVDVIFAVAGERTVSSKLVSWTRTCFT